METLQLAGEVMADDQLPVMKGTLDLLLLKALSWAPMHGVEIIGWLESRSGGTLGFDDSAVYQGLYRMEKRGLVRAQWGVSDNNRRARYYELTRKGRAHLEQETARLIRSSQLVATILTAPVTEPRS
jgi:PadR family transcriptional regulator, regulatory protein PadR